MWKSKKPPPVYTVTDAKYRSSELGNPSYGKQLSDDWILHHLDNLDLPKSEVDAIMDAIDNNTLIRKVQQVDENGAIIERLVNQFGDYI